MFCVPRNNFVFQELATYYSCDFTDTNHPNLCLGCSHSRDGREKKTEAFFHFPLLRAGAKGQPRQVTEEACLLAAVGGAPQGLSPLAGRN